MLLFPDAGNKNQFLKLLLLKRYSVVHHLQEFPQFVTVVYSGPLNYCYRISFDCPLEVGILSIMN